MTTTGSPQQPSDVEAAYGVLREIAADPLRHSTAEAEDALLASIALLSDAGEEVAASDGFRLLGQVLQLQGQLDGADEALQRAYELAVQADSPRGQAAAQRILGDVALHRNEWRKANRHFRQALGIYQDIDDLDGAGAATVGLAKTAAATNQWAEAQMLLNDAVAAFRRSGDQLGEANVLRNLADIAMRQSNYDEARHLSQLALALYRENHAPLGQANALRNLGEVDLLMSRLDEAWSELAQAHEIYRDLGDQLGEANALWNLADVATRGAQYEDARRFSELALRIYRSLAHPLGEANALRNLGEIDLLMSRYESAKSTFQQALTKYQAIGDKLGEANAMRNLGEIDVRMSRYHSAETLFHRALTKYQDIGHALGEASTLRNLGEVAVRQGLVGEARGLLERALELYQDLGVEQGRADSLLALGQLDCTTGLDQDGQQRLRAAKDIYSQAGNTLAAGFAAWQLARFEDDGDKRIEAATSAIEQLALAGRPELMAEVEAEFVPRDRELAEILSWIEASQTPSDSRSLVIIGSPGSGKSTLLRRTVALTKLLTTIGAQRSVVGTRAKFIDAFVEARAMSAKEIALSILRQAGGEPERKRASHEIGLEELVGHLKSHSGTSLIVVDALDEAAQPEETARVLGSLVEADNEHQIRVLVGMRQSSGLIRHLPDADVLDLDERSLPRSSLAQLVQTVLLTAPGSPYAGQASLAAAVAEEVSHRAEGNPLHARVAAELLLNRPAVEDPTDLPELLSLRAGSERGGS